MKRSQGTTPCVVKDSSCHIMQAETINGHKEFVLQFSDSITFFYLKHFYVHIFKKKNKEKNFVNESTFGNKTLFFLFTLKSKYISPIS